MTKPIEVMIPAREAHKCSGYFYYYDGTLDIWVSVVVAEPDHNGDVGIREAWKVRNLMSVETLFIPGDTMLRFEPHDHSQQIKKLSEDLASLQNKTSANDSIVKEYQS